MIGFLKVFSIVWIGFVVLVNLVAAHGIWTNSASAWDWFLRLQIAYSPFITLNYVRQIVLLSPAIGAVLMYQRMQTHQYENWIADYLPNGRFHASTGERAVDV